MCLNRVNKSPCFRVLCVLSVMALEVKFDYGDESGDPVIAVLKHLAEVDDGFDILSMVQQWRRRGCFTPKQMALVAWRLHVHDIDHQPSEFRVSSNRETDKDALLEMPDWKRQQLAPYLTLEQRREFCT